MTRFNGAATHLQRNPNPILKRAASDGMSPPPPPPSPMQGHRRRHWIGSPPPPLYLAIESELPRHWRPRGCIQGGIGVHAAAAVKLHKVEEPNYGSTVYTQRYQSYDPNNGTRVRLQVCNPNPNRVKEERKSTATCRCFTTDSLPQGYRGSIVRASAYAKLDGERKR